MSKTLPYRLGETIVVKIKGEYQLAVVWTRWTDLSEKRDPDWMLVGDYRIVKQKELESSMEDWYLVTAKKINRWRSLAKRLRVLRDYMRQSTTPDSFYTSGWTNEYDRVEEYYGASLAQLLRETLEK